MKILLNLKFNIALLLISVMFTGCSDNNNESIESLLKDKASTLTAQEKVKELLIMTEGNYTQLACILDASPSTLKRLYKGETFATPKAEAEINKHYNYFLVKGKSIENFKADCISHSWYNQVKNFMSNWWFGVITAAILYFLYHINPNTGPDDTSFFTFFWLFLIFIFYVIIWIVNYFFGAPDYGIIQDNFINTMNTDWESQI
jgi:hypothetical protein